MVNLQISLAIRGRKGCGYLEKENKNNSATVGLTEADKNVNRNT